MILTNTPGRITSVTATNFKWRDFTYPITPVTVFCGKNYSGKTAALKAIVLGLYGYDAKIGKQTSATWKYAGPGKEMSVKLACERLAINHKWTRSPKGTVSFKNGLEFEIPPVLLDAREYLNQKNEERTKSVFRLCDLGAFKVASVLDALQAIEVIPTKVSAPIIEGLVAEIKKVPSTGSAADWLAAIVEHCKAKSKEATALSKHLAGNTTAFTPKVITGPSPKDVSAELAAARAELQALNSQIAVVHDNSNRVHEQADRRAQLTQALNGEPDYAAAIASQEAEMASWSTVESHYGEIEREKNLISAQMSANSKRYADLRAADGKLAAEYADALSKTACPYCGANRQGWETQLKATLTRQRADNASLQKDCQAEYTKLQVKASELDKRLEAAAAIEHGNTAAQIAINLCKDNINNLKFSMIASNAMHAELDAMKPIGSSTLPPDIESQLRAAEEKIATLAEQQRAFEAVQNDRTRAGQEEQKLLGVNVNCDVLKLAIKTIVGIQEKQVELAFNTLLAKTRPFTDGILESPLEYREGELGRVKDGHWISHDVFSGCEQSVAYVSLSIALAQSSPIKVVMFDEASMTFSPEMKTVVINKMIELTSNGTIDNCFLADPDAGFWKSYPANTALSVINLNEAV